jgi:hypothetical protein
MILKKSGLTTKLRWEIPTFSFAVKKTPDEGMGSPYLSRTKPTSVFAAESNLTAPASVCKAAFSGGGTYWLVEAKVPLGNNPRKRNSRLNKTDKANAVFLTRDIKNEVALQTSIDRWNIKSYAARRETLHRNVTIRRRDEILHARAGSYD